MFNDLNKMKSFSLNIPVLKETIAKLEISIKNIEKIGTDVENIGDRLVFESWEGNATNSFKEHQQDWKKGYDEMVIQLIDFKESLEKVVLAGAEEMNELALELVVAFGGSQGAGYRDIISMEQEGIEELKAKCKALVYEDYEEQREIMGRIENLSSKLNYSFSIGAEAAQNKRLIEENQDKLQSFKGKLQNYEDRVLLFEQEVVDEMSKYAVICGHKLSPAEFREVLKYQKDDNWKRRLREDIRKILEKGDNWKILFNDCIWNILRNVDDIWKMIFENNNWKIFLNEKELSDIEELLLKGETRELAESIIANPVFVSATQHPHNTHDPERVATLALFYLGGFVMDGDGVYHARQEWSIQSFKYSGYNDFYDTVFDYATDMDNPKFQFSDEKGNEYVLWAWKGDYLNLGAGAEMGIYKRMVVDGISKDHWLIEKDLAMPMTLTLTYNGKQIISYDPKIDDPKMFDPLRKSTDKWWVTGFNPEYQDVDASDLTATYTVDFSDRQDLYEAFISSWDYQNNIDKWSISEDNKYKMIFTFDGEGIIDYAKDNN